MLIHIVEMLRWGSTEKHHYIVGCYTNLEKAHLVGDAEKTWRGGKYEYHIISLVLNEDIDAEIHGYHKECMQNEITKQNQRS